MDFQLNLDSETVGQIGAEEALAVESGASIRDVLQLLKTHRKGAALISNDGQIQGIFTERDALRLMAADADLDAPIDTVMIANLVSVAASDTVGSAIQKMAAGGYRQLPILGKDGATGMLNVPQVLHYLVEHFPNVVYTLPPEPHHSAQAREGA